MRLRVVGEAGEIDEDAGVVADDPGVVSGRYPHRIPRSELDLLPVVGEDRHAPGDAIAQVRRLARFRPCDRLLTDGDDLEFSFGEIPGLVGLVQRLALRRATVHCHLSLPSGPAEVMHADAPPARAYCNTLLLCGACALGQKAPTGPTRGTEERGQRRQRYLGMPIK